MKFIIEVPHQDIQNARADGINRQQIAKLIRYELQACGGHYEPGDWRFSVLRNVGVKAEKDKPVKKKRATVNPDTIA